LASISITYFQLVVKFNKLIKFIKAFSHNEIIELIQIITAFGHNKLIKLNNINHSHKSIVVNLNHEGAWAPSVTSNKALRWIVVLRLDRAALARSIAYVVVFDHIKLIVAYTLILHFEETLAPQNLVSTDSFKLIVEFISEGARFTPTTLQTFMLIVTFEGAHGPLSKLIVRCSYSMISFHFSKDCRIFCEGVNGNSVVEQKPENNNQEEAIAQLYLFFDINNSSTGKSKWLCRPQGSCQFYWPCQPQQSP
jgi:hypothetical protein